MNDKDLINNLKELRNIEPDTAYSDHSRFLILSLKKNILKDFLKEEKKLSFYDWFFGNSYLSRLAPSFGIIITIIAISYVAFSYLPTQQKKLVAEANEMNAEIQIKLNGIQYYLDNNNKISQSDTIKIINLLQKSAEELSEAKNISSDKENIESAITKIKNAQETLQEINELLK